MGKPYVRQVEVVGLVEQLGTVILFDDMEDLFKWIGYGTGTDYVVEKSTTVAFNGSASLHMRTRATTPAPGDYVAADRRIGVPYGKKVKFECRWRVDVVADLDNIRFVLRWFDGAKAHVALIRWQGPEEKWQYYGDDGAMHDIPGGVQSLLQGSFHRIAYTVDFTKNEYGIFQCDDLLVDLKGTKFRVDPYVIDSNFQIEIAIVDETGNRPEAYIDDVFVKEM